MTRTAGGAAGHSRIAIQHRVGPREGTLFSSFDCQRFLFLYMRPTSPAIRLPGKIRQTIQFWTQPVG